MNAGLDKVKIHMADSSDLWKLAISCVVLELGESGCLYREVGPLCER